MKKKTPLAALSLLALMAAAGCQTRTDVPVVGAAVNSFTGMHDQKMSRLETAAHSAVAQGKTAEALGFYAELYGHDKSADVALNYAQLLRKSGKTQKAIDILSGLVLGGKGDLKEKVSPVLLDEYAAANLEAGKYDIAAEAAARVLDDEAAKAQHADAHNLLGIALDAQGNHKEAEQNYRIALEGWKGNPSSVLNNLGLCLAAQGLFDQSLSELRLALLKAPQKDEIARNIDMVSGLRRNIIPAAPVPITKK